MEAPASLSFPLLLRIRINLPHLPPLQDLGQLRPPGTADPDGGAPFQDGFIVTVPQVTELPDRGDVDDGGPVNPDESIWIEAGLQALEPLGVQVIGDPEMKTDVVPRSLDPPEHATRVRDALPHSAGDERGIGERGADGDQRSG